ncbi:helix-turn-helix domain-containing protein [Fredinandcohnia sp. 179-A 10B2 NHS]|uniref:helix-turn-helix domain-containing protein n=1 Tax=Fredinandcohnia sp. 179-A 10B2 NHS TaxID=3235176 RepID=UPI0039A06379
MTKKHIGEQIKMLRTQRGLTLKELGEDIKFNYSNLSKIERGLRKPTVDFLKKLSEYYKVDISYFFDGEDHNKKQLTEMDLDWFMLSQEVKSKNVTFEELKEMAEQIAKIKNYDGRLYSESKKWLK